MVAAQISMVSFPRKIPFSFISTPIVGFEYNDTVTIASGVTISQQSIGVADNSDAFYPIDGVLG